MFTFLKPMSEIKKNVLYTAMLFGPLLSYDIPENFLDLNLHFSRNYLNHSPKKRESTESNPHSTLPLKEHIKSGDVFMLLRYGGLDPLISWAVGSNYGHVAIAM